MSQCSFVIVYPDDDEAHVCQLEQWHEGDHVCLCGLHFVMSALIDGPRA